ncbi:putative cytochrome P450-dependent fatty acid hydroxylase [Balamuthia mandrillaris]
MGWALGWAVLAVMVAAIALKIIEDIRYRRRRQSLPGPRPLPLFGNILLFSRNWQRRHWLLLGLAQKHGRIFEFWLLKHRVISTTDPDIADYFLNRNFKNYERGPRRRKDFKELLGDGIFTADGRDWMLHRKLAKPLFRTASIDQGMVPVFANHIRLHVFSTLRAAAKSGEPLDIAKLFMSFTMATFLELGLGCRDGTLTAKQRNKFQRSFDGAQEQIIRRAFNPLQRFSATKIIQKHVSYLDKHVYAIIRQRKQESLEELRNKTDIFSQFLAITDDDGKPLTDKYLRDVFLNFLIAGRDTTAAALTWAFYNLSLNPKVEQKLVDEVKQIVSGEVPTSEEIHQLTFARNVMTETLRLYPSVPFDTRVAINEDVLPNGTKVFPGDEVQYTPFCMGRTEYPDAPLQFRPERWTEEKAKEAYLKGLFTAFHLGPQTCLGKEMAYTEAVQTLCSIVKRFELRLVPGEEYKTFTPTLILSPRDGMMVCVTERAE